MGKEKKPVDIVVAEFAGEDAAKAALKELKGKFDLRDAAVIKHTDKKVKIKETKDMGGGKGAVVGGVLAATLGLFTGLTWVGLGAGALAGGLAAKLHDANLPNEQLKALGDSLNSGDSMLVAVVDQGNGEGVKAALASKSSKISIHTFDSTTVAKLEAPEEEAPHAVPADVSEEPAPAAAAPAAASKEPAPAADKPAAK